MIKITRSKLRKLIFEIAAEASEEIEREDMRTSEIEDYSISSDNDDY